jgi:hypothetical protein
MTGKSSTVLWSARVPRRRLVREIAGGADPPGAPADDADQPLDEPLTTAIADGDSFRYYPDLPDLR